jgi:cell division protein FtsB
MVFLLRSMRLSTIFILMILLTVQAGLWFGKGSVPRAMALQSELQAQNERNAKAQVRNEQLTAEVRDLQEGLDMAEEIARTELGMIKPDEIFVQLTP